MSGWGFYFPERQGVYRGCGFFAVLECSRSYRAHWPGMDELLEGYEDWCDDMGQACDQFENIRKISNFRTCVDCKNFYAQCSVVSQRMPPVAINLLKAAYQHDSLP